MPLCAVSLVGLDRLISRAIDEMFRGPLSVSVRELRCSDVERDVEYCMSRFRRLELRCLESLTHDVTMSAVGLDISSMKSVD